jgi:hypothetical protein
VSSTATTFTDHSDDPWREAQMAQSKEFDHGSTVPRTTGQKRSELKNAGYSDSTAAYVSVDHDRLTGIASGSPPDPKPPGSASGAPGPMAEDRDGIMVARNQKFPK